MRTGYAYLGKKEEEVSCPFRIVLAIRGLELYVHGSKDRLMEAARGDKIDGLEAASVWRDQRKRKN